MNNIQALIAKSTVHAEWQPLLSTALTKLDESYLAALLEEPNWLPGVNHLFKAFQRNLKSVRYLLIGESPYPRQQSANGIAFYDAAVGDLWSDTGLSKAVNRATSMRNILKTALRAEGYVTLNMDGKITQQAISRVDKTGLIKTMAELFGNLHRCGFLMLNATPVLHPDRKPAQEALFWRGFLQSILAQLVDSLERQPTLVLWGKIAKSIEALPAADRYQKLVSEHPYNISFIDNSLMQDLFAELQILAASKIIR
ncbi:MAG: uracil-DNA glycosylase [Gammaproteobacteria bacterium]|nr:uracil-DNA glycosylase [Gammaproteobacteria bacterium]